MTDLQVAAFAARKHRMQRRKDAEASSYIHHPLEVAAILGGQGGVTGVLTLESKVPDTAWRATRGASGSVHELLLTRSQENGPAVGTKSLREVKDKLANLGLTWGTTLEDDAYSAAVVAAAVARIEAARG